MKKINFNVLVEENASNEFEKWHDNLPGQKGDKLTGGLKAIQALHEIDNGLAYKLMSPTISIKDAVELIRKTIVDAEVIRVLEPFSSSQKAQVLALVKGAKEKLAQKDSFSSQSMG